MRMHYRVYEPDTPPDLPLELVQEYVSEIRLVAGMAWEMSDGEFWKVESVEDDPDPNYAGRVVLTRHVK